MDRRIRSRARALRARRFLRLRLRLQMFSMYPLYVASIFSVSVVAVSVAPDVGPGLHQDSPITSSEAEAVGGLSFVAHVQSGGSDPTLSFTLTNENATPVAVRSTGLAPWDVALDITNEASTRPPKQGNLDTPISFSIRSRVMLSHARSTESAQLSMWGFHLPPGTYRVRASRRVYFGRAVLTATPITITIPG